MTDSQPFSSKTVLVYCIYSGARRGTCLCYALTGLLCGPSIRKEQVQQSARMNAGGSQFSLAEPHPRSASANPLRFAGVVSQAKAGYYTLGGKKRKGKALHVPEIVLK